jgi:2-C-methyl-D-erythritol 4-phosphate cytidylyltransferase
MTIDTARALGIPVLMVPSPATNLKLTTSHDLIVLEAILAAEEGRSQARRDDP